MDLVKQLTETVSLLTVETVGESKEDLEKNKKKKPQIGCFNCGEKNQFFRNCPEPRKKKPEVKQVEDNNKALDVHEHKED